MNIDYNKIVERIGKYFLLLSLAMLGLAALAYLLTLAFPSMGCDIGLDLGIAVYCGDIKMNTPVEYIFNIPITYSYLVLGFLPMASLDILINGPINSKTTIVLLMGLLWLVLTISTGYFIIKMFVRNFRPPGFPQGKF